MRLVLLLAVIVLLVVCEARQHKHDRRQHHRQRSDHGGGRRNHAGASHKHHKNHHKDHDKNWLHLKEVSGCNCPHGEVCVGNPGSEEPMCVKKHFIKESKKLFKHFKKEKEEQEMMMSDAAVLHDNFHHQRKQHHRIDATPSLHLNVHSMPRPGHPAPSHNNVLKTAHHKHAAHFSELPRDKVCTPGRLEQMPQRLSVWFRELQKLATPPHHGHHRQHRHLSVKKELREHHEGHCKCVESVMHELRHLDRDHDHHLSQSELKEMEHNDLEPCLVPFLSSCDHDGDTHLSANEWCCCFSNVQPPCYRKLKEVQRELYKHSDMHVPRCDKQGFFAAEQCHGATDGHRTCWCVDLNGNELKGTRTHGHAHCGKLHDERFNKIF